MRIHNKFMTGVAALAVVGATSSIALVGGVGIAGASGPSHHSVTGALGRECYGLDEAAADAGLTATQTLAVAQAMETYMSTHWSSLSASSPVTMMSSNGAMSSILSTLVTNGVLSQSQATSFVSDMRSHSMMGAWGNHGSMMRGYDGSGGGFDGAGGMMG